MNNLSFTNFSKDELTFLRGIEKEGLRTVSRRLSNKSHPKSLGSALTNKYITLDYSECLLEMVTPPLKEVEELIDFLKNLHIFVYDKLNSKQILWASSMPCTIPVDKDIPIANFGSSNIGKMKHIYRYGLGHRYSRKMQSIAGIHYNFSFSDEFWQKYMQEKKISKSLKDVKNSEYFSIIRNILRYSDLLIYLFGCSPIADESFLKKSENKCLTSIRMSKFGYTSDKQKQIKIFYDDLHEYNDKLVKFMHKKDKDYQNIGIKNNGQYQQLNDCVLQIEDEYYNIVRPKQSQSKKKTPSQKLNDKGVEYIELRLIDLNVFSPMGISKEQIYFLDIFILFCLSEKSPLISKEELKIIEKNHQRIISSGCEKHFMHIQNNQELICFKEWGKNIFTKLISIAKQIDEVSQTTHYSDSINFYHNQFKSSNNLANKFKKELKESQLNFVEFVEQKSKQYQKYFLQQEKNSTIQNLLEKEVQTSIEKQQELEENFDESFEQFLQQHYQSNQLCRTTS